MKNLVSTVVLILFVKVAFAQNYYPVNRKDIYYYSDSLKSVAFALKIDSVKLVGQDSIYYMYKQIRNRTNTGTNFNCQFTGLGDSWFGNRIKIAPDGSCTLLNKKQSEFLIKTKANLNENWIAYQNTKWKAELTFTSKAQETFLGITDSVKIFKVNILKANDSDTTHPYDGIKFKISKNYGFIELVNIFTWDNSGDYNENQLYRLKIEGIENSKIGLYNYTVQDIYNFSAGDIFHYEDNYNCICPNKYFSQRIDSITGISENDSSVNFNIHRKLFKKLFRKSTATSDSSIYDFSDITIRISYKNYSYLTDFNRFRFKFNQKLNDWTKEYFADLHTYNGKIDTCISLIVDGGSTSNYYLNGLGISTNKFQTNNFDQTETLVYYKKGNQTWGDKIVLSLDPDYTELNFSFKIMQNPAKDVINYSCNKPLDGATMNILNSSGIPVLATQLHGKQNSVEISTLAPGLYFYRVSNGGKNFSTGKIMVE